MTRPHDTDCDSAREWIHAALDADLMDAGSKQRLEAHLSRCSACRELESEYRRIQEGLRALPELEMPDAALEQVWNRTSRARRGRAWQFAAAAAMITVMILGGIWLREGSKPSEPTETELQQAARDARMVLRIASQAMHRTERAAVGGVLTGEVSRALQRVPVEWPSREATDRSGS